MLQNILIVILIAYLASGIISALIQRTNIRAIVVPVHNTAFVIGFFAQILKRNG